MNYHRITITLDLYLAPDQHAALARYAASVAERNPAAPSDMHAAIEDLFWAGLSFERIRQEARDQLAREGYPQ